MKKKIVKRILSAALAVCMTVSGLGISVFAENAEETETLGTEDISDTAEENSDADTDGTPDEDTPSEGEPTEDVDTAVAGGNAEFQEVTVPAKNIKLKVPQRNQLTIGDTFEIKYRFSPIKSDDTVTYKSFRKSVVRVDEYGLVKAVGVGEAQVQMRTSKGIKKNVYFTVIPKEEGEEEDEFEDIPVEEPEVTEIEFDDKYIMLRAGKTYQPEPLIYPLGLTAEITYSSSDKSVATVSSSGKIKGVSAGTATITATADNGVSEEINVTVYDDVLRGIDVSKWQGVIDWKKVSVAGIDFVMIRSSFGSEHTDEMLDKNVAGCEKYGIPYGFYHYTYARTPKEARNEAGYFLNAIRKYSPEYPIVLDIEESFYKSMSKKEVTAVMTAFMDVIEEAGYYGMVYNAPNFIKACLDEKKLKKYDIWIACWGDEERLNYYYDGNYGMWQYSSTGSVKGINGDVDLDYAYKDYAAIIRKKGLNHLGTE